MSFIFGGNTEMSYEDLQRKRRIADAMIGQNSNAPRNVGEGLAAIGRALAARAIDKRVSAREKELQSDADKMWQAAMGGFDMGGMYGGSSASGGGYGGGGYAAAPYTPDATDPAESGGGGYALGDSVPQPEMVASPKGDLAMGADLNWLTYANQGAIRSQPISPELENALSFLPDLGVSMEVFSGGQDASGPHRTGSTRHNHGGAADVFFSKDGRRLDWNNPSDQPIFAEIVKRAKANGVTGFGAGEGYMQPGSMHIGFGNPAVWGAGGKGANAAPWLQAAYGGVPSSGGVSPGGGYSGPSVAAIARVMANPMIRNDPAKMAIANMLMQRSMQASDPMYQLQLQQAQLQLDQARKGPKREIVKGADGFNYYLDTGERVLPNVQAAPPAKPGSVQEYEYGLNNPGYNDWSRANKEAGATKINMEGEKAYDKEIGKNLAEKTTGIIDAGMAAPNKIAEYRQLGQALANSYTGTGGDTVLALKKIGTAMGWDVGDVGDAELAKALGNKLALELRNPAGGAGMPGAMSDKDREFLVSSVPGLSKTASGNAKLVEMAIAVQERNAKVAEMANRYMDANGGRLDRGFFAELAQWSAKNPLFDYNLPPEPAETPAPPSGFNSDGKMPAMSDADKAYLKELGFEVD